MTIAARRATGWTSSWLGNVGRGLVGDVVVAMLGSGGEMALVVIDRGIDLAG